MVRYIRARSVIHILQNRQISYPRRFKGRQGQPIFSIKRKFSLSRSFVRLRWRFFKYVQSKYNSVNYIRGPMENRLLLTGLHTIADIHCVACNANLGWVYVRHFFFLCITKLGFLCLSFFIHTQTNRLLNTSQEEAFEEDQKYKVGKVILEKATICRVRA